MDNIEYFKAIQQSLGTSSKAESKKRYERDRLARELKNSVNYVGDALLREQPYPMIIIPDSNDPNVCKIESVDNSETTFEIGDVIETGGKRWMVTAKEQTEFVQSFGEMRLCNQEFRWQDAAGVAHSAPGIFSTAYRVGRLDRNFNDAHGQFEGLIPYNEDTKKIPLNQRFVLWVGYDEAGREIPVTYVANRIDHNSLDYGSKSIIVIELARDTYNANDSIEHMIADYREVAQSSPSDRFTAAIKGGSTLRAGGNTRVLTPAFNAGTGAADPARAVWTFDTESPVYQYLHFETNSNGSIEIRLGDDAPKSVIGETVKVTLSDNMDVFASADKLLEVI